MLLFNIRFDLYPCYHPLAVQAQRLLLLQYGLIMDFVFQTLVGDHLSLSLLIQVFSSSASLSKKIEDQAQDLREDQEETSSSESSSSESLSTDSKSLASGVFFFPDPSLNDDDHPCDTSADVLYKDSVHKQEKDDDDNDDDDTASTFDMMDCDDEYPISPCSSFRRVHSPIQSPLPRRNVHFPEQLVTHIFTRPFTTQEDKYYLHYDEHDFMDFKLQYRADILEANHGSRRQARRSSLGSSEQPPMYYRKSGSQRVSFKREVVASIHPVMDLSARKKIQHDLFYTEQEMRQFLDDFVVSLQQLGSGQQEQEQS
mmetsp:Transcript_22338/g.22670  ORF Transcript_22338/g.22670 Transcript_22338/m.22670 type:complete len:313 (-) Transcript_22338:809-1747(-)